MVMRKFTKLVAVAGFAGLVAVGGEAFTASNTVPDSIAGYGQSAVTGATITNIAYTSLGTDASKLASVVFTSSTDVTGKNATMTLRLGSAVVGTPYSCTLGSYSSTMTITCATADNPDYTAFDTTGLTVAQ
jgi:hypothetical protein